MLQFILRRLGLVIPTFIGSTPIRVPCPHDPGRSGDDHGGRTSDLPERHAQLLAELGLDKPMWQQYIPLHLGRNLTANVGISMKSRIPVWGKVVPRFQATLELGVCAMFCYGSRYSGWCAGCG